MNWRANPHLAIKLQGWRATLVLVLILAAFAGLAGRAFYLQALNKDFLQERGEARYMRVVETPVARGTVRDRFGEPVAVSTPAESIWANPSEVDLTSRELRELAKELGMSAAEIKNKLADTERSFVYLKRQMPLDQAQRVIRMKLAGVHHHKEYRRTYPLGEVMAHVLGFTGVDENGQEGIELALQDQLKSEAGSRVVIKDRRGRIVEDLETLAEAREGKDILLTIDRRLQYLAWRELKSAVEANRAKGGSVVVLDAKSGEILALVSQPDFNPNVRGKRLGKELRNRSITDLFEPGSTFKPFSVAAALESGKFKPTSMIDTGSGNFVMGANVISDTHANGVLSVAQIVQKSSNVGTAKMALTLPAETLHTLYRDVGFGEAPRSGFPGEATGRLRSPTTWKPIEQATISYGYGVSVSLLQLARAYTVFTNAGEVKPVRLIKADDQPIAKRALSPRVVAQINDMMELAVNKDGTAPKAQVAGYRIAGKTGTARKIENGQYVNDKYVSSFVGFGPVSDPRFIVAVMIDEPNAGHYYGGVVAAPAFSGVMAGALRMHAVPPDAPNPKLATQPGAREEG